MRKWMVVLFAAFAAVMSAASIDGTWKGSADTPMGKIERTFVFHTDHNTLTGESSSSLSGKSTIKDGKVDGDNVTFTLDLEIQGNPVSVKYTGKISGDEIKLTAHVEGMDQEIVYTVHRTS